uniref:Protein kinase domain-containing protein n=2 Tax=Aegilops tauschii subsp. strangulata TaxID=200361 RepID=A0A452ZZ70_AEGTS
MVSALIVSLVLCRKYMPPEFIKYCIISPKNDVFSLGVVMIEIMTAPASYSNYLEVGNVAQLMQQVLTNCTMVEATSNYRSEEIRQLETCIKLAIRCVDSERDNRPSVADILDTLNETETRIPKRQLTDVPLYPATGPKYTMGNTLKTTRDEQDNITNEHQNCSSMAKDNNSNLQQVGDIRETTSSMKEALIIGRTKEKQKILSILSESSTQEITFLPIYGIGGIGKTTMAQLVFNDLQFKEYSRVWTYVSQTFDMKKIGNSIITQLSGNKSEHTDLQMIENSLQKLLSGKRVLIILDDLWERQSSQLKKLEGMLKLGEGGKVVVVVTTREESIAQNIHTDTVEPYKLAPLTDDICWTIIKIKSSFETRAERAQLELIGKEIAKKCGGLALAAQSIGYTLGNMEFDEWVSVNNSEIWDVLATGEYSPDHVHASLQLTYHRMDPYLKLCFAYCATFPKGHWMAIEDLIYQWIALGLVEPSRTFSNIQTGHKYIRHLFGTCFIEHPSWSQSTSYYSLFMKPDNFLIMHDLAHDLARSVLANEINIESPSCRYAWLTDHRKLFKSSMNPLAKLFKSSMDPLTKIRALHFIDRGSLQLHAEALSGAKCLCVLDLSKCCAQELPDSIGQLKQLRYLDASWNVDVPEPPEYPDPPESTMIPKALGSLNKLQYLNLSFRRRPIGLPEVIRKLTELRYLNTSFCEGYYLLDSPSANQSFIDCIGTLPNLEQLDMSWNDYVFCVPESFSRLKKLNLSGCNQISSLPENVGKVDIPRLFGLLDHPLENDGFHVRPVDSGSGSSLVWLKHTNPDVLCIDDLQNVKSVEEARSIRLMEKNRIETLSLKWHGGMEHIELLTVLMPPSSVKNLDIRGYMDDICPHWFMHIGQYLPNLVSLELCHFQCNSLPTLVQPPNLRKIVLRHMENLEKFNILAKLEHLEIYDCPNLRFKLCLPRAVYWYISRSDNVLSWGQCAWNTASSCPVSELKVDSELPLCHWSLLHQLRGLRDLAIYGCKDLTIPSWRTRSFTSLESLLLYGYHIHKLPEWLGELTSLWRLNLCLGNLQELHKNMRQLTQLQSLSLEKCNKLTSLPQWLGELTLLKTLKLYGCNGIISLPESAITNLQELRISVCHVLFEWCKLEKNKMKLAHIKEKSYSDSGQEGCEEDLG